MLQDISNSIFKYFRGRWTDTKVYGLHENGDKRRYFIIEDTVNRVSYKVTVEEL